MHLVLFSMENLGRNVKGGWPERTIVGALGGLFLFTFLKGFFHIRAGRAALHSERRLVEAVTEGGLRPLRNPTQIDEFETPSG